MTKTKLFVVLLLLSLLTIIDHSYLAYEFYNLHSGMSEGQSLCNVSSLFNCDAVAASSYAQLAGIPMALLGLVTQLALLILLISGHFNLDSNPAQVRRYFFWGVCFVAVVSVVMGSISTFKLGTYCLFCMGAYLLSVLSLITGWLYRDSDVGPHIAEDIKALFTSNKWVLGVAIAVPAGSFVLNGISRNSYDMDRLNQNVKAAVMIWQKAPEQKFDLTQGLPLQVGNQAPVMTIVEFADFRCPHCRLAYPSVDAFVEGHSDVKLIFKSFPLDGVCNKALTRSADGLTCKLALSAFCAEDLSQKGWKAHHWIYDRQEQFHSAEKFPDDLHQMSTDLGLDEQKMKDCINSDTMTQKIQSMAAEGANAKIEGTPAIFVNNKGVPPTAQILPILQGIYQDIKSGPEQK